MKSERNSILVLVVILLIGSIITKAQNNFILKSTKASVQGTSTLHDWESEISKIDFKGSFITEGLKIKEIKGVEVKILVEGIKSTKGKIMDEKTYDAFKYKSNPYIIYKIANVKIVNDASGASTIETTGTLSMAGVTRTILMTVVGKTLSNGDLQLSLTKKINMTDFKMEPPTAVLGTIKVGEEVTVLFDLILKQKQLAEL